jgi:hypothetical protein
MARVRGERRADAVGAGEKKFRYPDGKGRRTLRARRGTPTTAREAIIDMT